MKLTETKLDELMNVAETENEQALLSILYAIKGARCLNAETLLASCVAEVVKTILLPIANEHIMMEHEIDMLKTIERTKN